MFRMWDFYRNHELLLAPMAGVTDKVFRRLCVEQGASLAFTEMVSAKGLSHANEKTSHLLDLGEDEREVAVQLFGHEPDTMAREAAFVQERLGDALALIDVNMGCPVRKIVSKGDGASLMTRPDLAADIVRTIAAAVKVPLTVKIRRGFAMGEELAPEFARRMEDAGAWAITVHGRFAAQMYRGASDRGVIKRVKEAVTVPVVGNGDVRTGQDARSMRDETGCDAIMIARAARGNPWIFAQCRAALDGDPIPVKPDAHARLAMLRRHVILYDEAFGPRLTRMRKDAMWYVAGMPGAADARRAFSSCSTKDDFLAALDALEERIGEDAAVAVAFDDAAVDAVETTGAAEAAKVTAAVEATEAVKDAEGERYEGR